VLPVDSVNNEADGGEADAVLASKGRNDSTLCCVFTENLAYLRLGQFREMGLFTSGQSLGAQSGAVPISACQSFWMGYGAMSVAACCSSLLFGVKHILKMRTVEEMGRIATRRIVAPMKHV
jgi:hypothetical protein